MLVWEDNLSWIWKIIMGVILVGISLEDIKRKLISFRKIIIFVLIAIICIFIFECNSIPEGLLGIIPGLCILGISYITRGKIGFGDGLVLTAMGIFADGYHVFLILVSALFIAALFSSVMLICRRFAWKSEMPFIPFLFIGYLGVVLC